MVRPILTIGVPTFNRVELLPAFFESLISAVEPLASHIVIDISDNCSDDGTEDLCRAIAESENSVQFRYFRNEKNIGNVANIVSLIENSQTDYFMFLGDDDFIDAEALETLISLLHAVQPSAVIQTTWDEFAERQSGFGTFDESLQYFYEFGNAWAGVMHAAAAREDLLDEKLKEAVLQTAWPQTALGYRAMWRLKERKSPYLLNQRLGGQYTFASERIRESEYWIKSLEGLLIAAQLVDEVCQDNRVLRSFVRFRNPAFRSRLRLIALECAIDSKRVHECESVVSHLVGLNRLRVGFWSVLLREACAGSRLNHLLPYYYAIRNRLRIEDARGLIRTRTSDRELEIKIMKEEGRISAIEGLGL